MAAGTKPTKALFKNHTALPQIFLDVQIDGYTFDRIRVLPGSKVTLPAEFGRNHRKILTEVEQESAEEVTK